MPTPANNNDKMMKLKKYILLGIVATVCIIGWHFYENFFGGQNTSDDQIAGEHEIVALTRKLYDEELEHHAYLERVNFQGKTKPHLRNDAAARLLLGVSEEKLKADSTSTIALMKRLFDNYILDTRADELVTADEIQEEMDFLQAVLHTKVMKHTMLFLEQKGLVAGNLNAQLQLLKDIWFTQYSRGGGRVGSTGFEHVFLAELKDNSVLGLHNWVFFSEQEQLGNLDYKGFIERVDLGKDSQHLLALRFTFHNIVKSYNTLFVGTSPELELSLYTVCFLLSAGKPCLVQLGDTKLTIITHAWDWHGKKTLATAYPSIH